MFECLDKEEQEGKVIYIDGYSRNEKKQAKIPDYVFFKEESKADLSNYGLGKKETVRGLINILNGYNFTVSENVTTDQEVALDPELLGKVFENLLASYTEETKLSARKATGSYYTPKEIVDYMVNISILEYLKIKCPNIDQEKLERLVMYSDVPELSFEDKKQIIEAIDNIKVLDPACGSGVFPMGILHKLVEILEKLDTNNKIWYDIQFNKTLDTRVEVIRSQINDKEEALKELEENFEESITYPDYARKLYLIKNCIYGVDIQPIAIHISKLRFFISLVIDQKIDKSKENYGIKALPNLETKFIAADFLKKLIKDTGKTDMVISEVIDLENQLKRVRERYFRAKTRTEKLKLQKKDREIREEIKKELVSSGFNSEISAKMAEFDLYDLNRSYNWFDSEWCFGVKEFDIVIGNPPYIQLQKEGGKLAKWYKDEGYEVFKSTGDIYCLFYERGLNLLKQNGLLCYITSNKWLRAGYGEKLREYLSKESNPKVLIDLGPGVFKSATVDTNIILVEKSKNKNNLIGVTVTGKQKFYEEVKQKGVNIKVGKDAWFIGDSKEQRLKEKIEKIGKPLKYWDVKIYRGVLTGLNEAFIISSEKREEILSNCKDEEERKRTEEIIKPILRGRDIGRYCYKWAGLWVIFIPWHFPLHQDLSIQGASIKAENEFKKFYSAIYNYLLEFKEALLNRNKEETGIRYEWYVLQRCAATYYAEFEKEKLVWQEIVREPSFCYDNHKYYCEATSFLMTGKNLKYLVGLLNSKPVTFFFRQFYSGGGLGKEGYRYKKAFLEHLPIPPITSDNQSIVTEIEELVSKVIDLKAGGSDTSELERDIDYLVYKLYDLTEEEIEVIERVK